MPSMSTPTRTCILVISFNAAHRLKIRMGTPPLVLGDTTDNRKFSNLRTVDGTVLDGSVHGADIESCLEVQAVEKLLALAKA